MVNKWQIECGDNFCSRRYNAIHLGCERESVTHPIRWVDILSVFVYNCKTFIIKNGNVANTQHTHRQTRVPNELGLANERASEYVYTPNAVPWLWGIFNKVHPLTGIKFNKNRHS